MFRKVILAVVLSCFSISCGFFGSDIEKSERGVPEEIRTKEESDNYTTAPDVNKNSTSFDFDFGVKNGEKDSEADKECQVSKSVYTTDTYIFSESFFVRFGGKKSGSVDVVGKDVSGADHLFLYQATLALDKTRSLEFLNSLKYWVGDKKTPDNLIAWKDNITNAKKRVVELKVDGQYDLVDIVKDDFKIVYEVRGKPPKYDLRIGGVFVFLASKNCL